MKLAGKYINDNRPLYEPDVFPDQRLMQMYASQTTNPILKEAALEFQYPLKCLILKRVNTRMRLNLPLCKQQQGQWVNIINKRINSG
jgi:hypothetical protein